MAHMADFDDDFDDDFKRKMEFKYIRKIDENGVRKVWNAHNWFFEGYKYFNANEWVEICKDRHHWIPGHIKDSKFEWIKKQIRERGLHKHRGDYFFESPEADYLKNEYFNYFYASSPHYKNPEAKWIAKFAMDYFPTEVTNVLSKVECPECRAAAHF